MQVITLSLRDDEYANYSADAAISGLPLDEWLRRRLNACGLLPRDQTFKQLLRQAEAKAAAEKPVAAAPAELSEDDRDPEADEARDDDDDETGQEEKESRAASSPAVPSSRRSRRIKNIAGQVFGRLTARAVAGRDKSGSCTWLCSCECGNEKVVSISSLTSGFTKSCGCLHKGRSPVD
jgi:hypothetical protein